MKAQKQIDLNEKIETSYCIPTNLRDEQIRINCKKVKGRIEKGELKDSPIAIVGFGPSLKKTWKELKKFKHIITCSGALQFLLKKGIVPNFHLDVDPREHKVQILGKPDKRVQYLPASCIHPKYVQTLLDNDCEVKLWHVLANDGESRQVIPAGEWMLTGGSDAGMRCMSIARHLGFTDFHIFGIDGSDDNKGRHADKHPNQAQFQADVPYGDKVFKSVPSLAQCALQVFHELDQLPDCTYKFYGEGLVQEIAKTYDRKTIGESVVAYEKPKLISDEMRGLNSKLHEDVPHYGMGGEKYAETVIKMKTDEIDSVLDYGAGKQTLAKALPFPIWSYDPAIPEIAEPPRPADLVICTDVLEHIEPDKLTHVFKDLARVTLKLGYFVIHLGAAKKHYADGRNAHLIQQPANWWVKNLKKFFDVHEPIQKGTELHAVVTPKSEHSDPIMAVKLGDKKARFYIPNDTCKWRAETLLTKEPVTIDWISRMKEGETMFDIGANVGGYTVWAGIHGVKTFAFEPEAENYSLLVRNARLNNLDARAYCIALSNKTGLDELHLSQSSAGGSCHTFGESKDFNLKDRPDVVKQGCVGMRLDDLKLPQPDHIKLDVDGLEHKVIDGAIETLKNVKTVLIEINPKIHAPLIAKMVELGFLYDEDQVEASKRKSGPFAGVAEYVFYRTDILKKIREAEVIEEPFPHMEIPDFLNVETDINAEYLPIEQVRGTKGYPERFVAKAPQIGLKNVWVRAALTNKFGVDGNIDETLLIRDKAGYKIGPHTDSPKRSLSMIVYLDDGEGTSLYVPNDPNFKCPQGIHYPFDNFTRVKTVSGKNTAFIFAKSDISFHGVEPTATDRHVLLYDVRHS